MANHPNRSVRGEPDAQVVLRNACTDRRVVVGVKWNEYLRPQEVRTVRRILRRDIDRCVHDHPLGICGPQQVAVMPGLSLLEEYSCLRFERWFRGGGAVDGEQDVTPAVVRPESVWLSWLETSWRMVDIRNQSPWDDERLRAAGLDHVMAVFHRDGVVSWEPFRSYRSARLVKRGGAHA